MKKTLIYTLTFILVVIANVACEKDTPEIDKPNDKKKIDIVSQFIYDGMSSFYLWAEDVVDKKPTPEHTNPNEYFESILYKPTDIWSWITDDAEELLSDFEGTITNAFGFNPRALWTNDKYEELIGFVRYVVPNTPAERVGIKRGDVIVKINGQKITRSNYSTLYGSNSKTTFTVLDQDWKNEKEIEITPERINSDPVLFYDTYEIDDKNIGYLFYTTYASGFNNSLYKAFERFKNDNITDLVLDLRYNPGGSISTAGYLLSLIAPKTFVNDKSVFTKMSYNTYVNGVYDKNGWERGSRLGNYNKSTDFNPINANIDLKKVYIITTNQSASASELTTFCLRPFMDVVHIGENTSGKYTASWTIHAYDDFDNRAQPVYNEKDVSNKDKAKLKNWAMQPIVGRYTDKDGNDFVKEGTLKPNYPIKSQELNTTSWKPIGDVNDYLFAKAISLITGRPYNESKVRAHYKERAIESNLKSIQEERLSRSVLLDNVMNP